MTSRSLLAALMLTTAMPAAAFALPATNYLTANVGWFDATQQDNQATSFGLEYRFNPYQYGIRPMVGAFGTTDGAAYGYAGIHWDLQLITDKLILSPNFAAGAYRAGSDGKRLGGATEFRSGIEMAYQLPNQDRLGVAFNHMSNASIYHHNPGVETILLNYSLALGN